MLKLEVKGVEAEFEKALAELQKTADNELSKNMYKSLVQLKIATPKDTGLAASSWSFEKIKDDRYGFDQYVLNNATDYIHVLNSGSSKQAPKRFIETTLFKYFEPNGVVVKKTTNRR